MFSLIWKLITSKIPAKVWLVIIAVLGLLGAFFWFRHSIYAEYKSDAKAIADAAKVDALELELTEAKQYAAFLLDNQRKNEDFIKRQRKALKDANEKDGDVSPLLRGTFERLHTDRKDQE